MALTIVESSFGSILIGVILFSILFGVLCMQVWSYFHNFHSKDPWWMQTLVAALWSLEAMQIGTTTHMIYTYLVVDWGQTAKLATASWDWSLYVGQSAVAATAVELFFARRMFMLAKDRRVLRWLIAGSVTILSILQLVFGLYVMGICYRLKYFAKFVATPVYLDLWLGFAVSADVIICMGMCYFLHTSRTGIRRTDHIINKLMAYSVQTGLVTTIAEISCLATFRQQGAQAHYGHVLLILPLGGLYSTSLLANLHARSSLSSAANNVHASGGLELSKTARSPNQISFAVNKTVETRTEEDTIYQSEHGKFEDLSASRGPMAV